MTPPASPHTDLGGYALEALDPDDRDEFERHLGGCATCQAELRELGAAGTFHPDEEGRSEVRLHAAVDPAKYPTLSVTAEPGDGRPQRTGAEVLRSEP